MMRKLKNVCVGFLTASMILSPLQAAAVSDQMTVPELDRAAIESWNGQASWEEVGKLLDKHLGVYEEPSEIGPEEQHTPDGPLMGNGTVLAFLNGKIKGDKKNQTIYISRLDNFEELNERSRDVQYVGYGGIDIKRTDSHDTEADFRMEQDMKLAQVKGVSESGFQTDIWLSAKENIIVTEITNLTEAPMELDISAWTTHTKKVDQGISSVDTGVDEENGVIYASRKTGCNLYNWSVNATLAVKLLGKTAEMKKVDNRTSKFSIEMEPGEKVQVVAAVEGGKEAAGDKEEAIDKVLSFDGMEKLEESKEAHQDWWKEYWMKSYMALDEQSDSIEKLYFGHMYQIGCALQAISENPAYRVTTGLFPWTGSSAPNWQGDFTLNSDVQRPISVAITANRLNHIENYTHVIEDFWDTGVQNASNPTHLNWLINGSAREKFTKGIRGSLYPTHIGPWGSRTEHFNAPNDYFCSPANGTMTMQPMIQYYKSTLDEEYLKKTLYPMVKELANFWVDYSEEENGQYNIYGATYEQSWAYKNATLDVASAEFILKNAIQFSEHLGEDSKMRDQWKEVHDNLAPYPTAYGYYINGEGQDDPNTFKRFSCFNVYGFAFYDLVGLSSPQEEKDNILNWLENEQEFGTGDKQTRAAMTSARVGFDPHIWLDQMKAGYIDSGVWDWMGIRPNNTVGDIGGTLFSGAIMESLMQSHEGFINFFPAWYDDQEAYFKSLRAYDAFTVSGSQNKVGQVTGAVIQSEKGSDCSVLNPWYAYNLGMEIYEDGTKIASSIETNSLGDVYTFPTKAGSEYVLKPDGELPVSIKIAEEEVEIFLGDTIELNMVTNTDLPIRWSTEEDCIATVEQGVITAENLGETVITAEVEGKNLSDSCIVKVIPEVKIPSELLSAVADSEEVEKENGAASNAVDGNEDSMWHSGYGENSIKPDIPNNERNSFTIDLGGTYRISKLEYLPRYKGSANGNILEYELWYSKSEDGDDFVEIGSGTWEDTTDRKYASFAPVEARRLQIRAMKTKNGDQFIAAYEFYVYKGIEELQISQTESVDIIVPRGTTWEKVKEMLPKKVKVQLDNNSTTAMAVEWPDNEYNGESVSVDGVLVCPKGVTNPENLTVTANIVIVDKSILKTLVDYANKIDLKPYTSASIENFNTALKQAEKVLDDLKAEQKEVDTAVEKLNQAILDLKEIEDTIEIAVQKLTLKTTDMVLAKGKSSTRTAAVVPTNATWQKVTYKSSATKIATVDQNGKVTAKATGHTTITASCSGVTASYTVYVKPAKTKIKSATSKKKKTVLVKWKKVDKASGYIIQVSTKNKKSGFKQVKKTTNNKTLKYTINKKIKAGKKANIRIQAYYKNGKKTVKGPWSKVKTIKVKK